MEKISNILGIVLRVLSIIVLTIVTGASLMTAYVVFAPDNLPKPFYLTYSNQPGANSTPGANNTSNVPTATATPVAVLEAGQGIMVTTSAKIINLNEPSGQRYIRVTIVLEFAPDDVAAYLKMTAAEKATLVTNFTTDLNAQMPIIDDTVITLLSTKTYDQLYTANGKETLRNELLTSLQQALPSRKIMAIYFTEFVVQ